MATSKKQTRRTPSRAITTTGPGTLPVQVLRGMDLRTQREDATARAIGYIDAVDAEVAQYGQDVRGRMAESAGRWGEAVQA